jgi:hypothetical protein
MSLERDPSLDTLLALDGTVFFVDAENRYAVRFVVKRVEADASRPHGLMYSLTLHDASGARIMGFDLAVEAGKGSRRRGVAFDHRHRFATVRPYAYSDAAALLDAFWTQVDSVLREKGIVP